MSFNIVGIGDIDYLLEESEAEKNICYSDLKAEFEFGEVFKFSNLGYPNISKLYTKNYDVLWIIIEKREITFEEITDDFEVYDNSIITQMVHLEYTGNGKNSFITHIDHEYIFYTLNEYELRKNNPNQKGEAKVRYKTFKVDNSKIPFVLENGDFFLYIVLDAYFKEKDLLKEYFANILH